MPSNEVATPVPAQQGEAAAPTADTVAKLLALTEQAAETAALQRETAKKQLFWTRLFACASCGLLAVVLVICLTVGPKVTVLLDNANVLVTQAGGVAADLALVAGQLVGADIPALLQNVNQLVVDGQTGLAQALVDMGDAVQALQQVDITTLNQSIVNLNNVVEPLARLFGH